MTSDRAPSSSRRDGAASLRLLRPALWLLFASALAGCGDPSWSATGAMITPRAYHTATALDNGKILFAGGAHGDAALAGVELYDPVAGGWLPTSAQMSRPRRDHTASFYFDEQGKGHVLLVGGDDGAGGGQGSMEVYDTESGVFYASSTQETAPRRRHTATLLASEGPSKWRHRILIAGGEGAEGPLQSAELFDEDQVAQRTDMHHARTAHTATLLQDGHVLIAGGRDSAAALDSAELYDPAADPAADPPEEAWTDIEDPVKGARACHTATLLADGRVLVVGGRDDTKDCLTGGDGVLSTAAVYDPETRKWCKLPEDMTEGRSGHTATLLDNGRLLIAGGEGRDGALDSAEIYDPRRPSEKNPCECDCGSWAPAGTIGEARAGHAAARLPDGSILIAGGMGDKALRSAAIYEPETQCRTLNDCPESLICNAQKQCVPPDVTCDASGHCAPAPSLEGSCSAAAGETGGASALFGAMAALLAALVRRRGSAR